MASLSATTWQKFFVAAGIPTGTAGKYAHVFNDNRIQRDMLGDLNKEYLREMGINTLGDIIAILRHSKTEHERLARRKSLAADEDEAEAEADSQDGSDGYDEGEYSDDNDAVVMLTSSIRNEKVTTSKPSKSSATVSSTAIGKVAKKPSTTTTTTVAKTTGVASTKLPPAASVNGKSTSSVATTKSRTTAAVATSTTTPKATAASGAALTADGKPVRRVLPEHEGRYKITLPAGTTARSKQILAKKAMLHSDRPESGKRGIFDRLELNGATSSTSSSTCNATKPHLTNTKITITGCCPSAKPVQQPLQIKSSTASAKPSTASAAAAAASSSAAADRIAAANIRLSTPSIFRRLGGKSASQSVAHVSLVAGGGGVQKPKPAQKVILVKKQPAKALLLERCAPTARVRMDDTVDVDFADDDADDGIDDYAVDNHHHHQRINSAATSALHVSDRLHNRSAEKCVSFSEEDEVLEFVTHKQPTAVGVGFASNTSPSTNKHAAGGGLLPAPSSVHAVVHVKDRLGGGGGGHRSTPSAPSISSKPTAVTRSPKAAAAAATTALLHRTRRTVPMKPSTSTPMQRNQPHVRPSVHSRLALGNKTSSMKVSSSSSSAVTSVFQRLGFND